MIAKKIHIPIFSLTNSLGSFAFLLIVLIIGHNLEVSTARDFGYKASEQIEDAIYIITTVIGILISWTSVTIHRRRLFIKFIETLSVVLLMACLIALFAIGYMFLGLTEEDTLITPSYQDALHFSILTFVNVGHHSFLAIGPSESLRLIEVIIGYFFTPFLVSVFVSILNEQGKKLEKSSPRDATHNNVDAENSKNDM